MRRKFLPILLALGLFLGPASIPTSALGSKSLLVDSIQPLQINSQTFCTAFAINKEQRLWATAAHCAVVGEQVGGTMQIWDYPVVPVLISTDHDFAILQSVLVAGEPIEVASRPAEVGDRITIKGYPYGMFRLITTNGFMGARLEPTYHGLLKKVILSDIGDITVARGNSGSPVLKGGKLIGVLWGRANESEHAVIVPWEVISRAFAPYME